MIFDTDILIWIQRGNIKAARLVEDADARSISVLTYMDLIQCARNKTQQGYIRDFLVSRNFETVPLTENIGHRAAIYIEEYSMSSGLRAGDAIIAATAAENNLILVTGNEKHFRPIKDLKVTIFKP
ncbi:MAG TPA: type II toxin-antitoxin system VapC family toxin [Spirochaetota bacterium]|nr:type II toxin-antitoxin system VapC family toxin [Spirochaetota bacterium]